jgi:hypothetical protein
MADNNDATIELEKTIFNKRTLKMPKKLTMVRTKMENSELGICKRVKSKWERIGN